MKIKLGNFTHDLVSANNVVLKSCFEADYKNDEQKKEHVHRKIYEFCAETKACGVLTYPVLNLTTLRTAKYGKLVDFLVTSFKASGVRPDTPFHGNDEGRYQAIQPGSDRYMELNTVGGGMRLVFDSTTQDIFLSSHYSDPVLLQAEGGSQDKTSLDNLAAELKATHVRIQKHSDGTILNRFATATAKGREQLRDHLALEARISPAFIAWLKNKNSGQDPGTVLYWYNVAI